MHILCNGFIGIGRGNQSLSGEPIGPPTAKPPRPIAKCPSAAPRKPPEKARLAVTYRIRTVCEMTGIPRNTLIAWERRYGFVKPERHENGYRSYSEEDVAKLRRVQDAMQEGLAISEAIEFVERSELAEQGRRDSASLPETTHLGVAPDHLELSTLLATLRTRLLGALLSYDAMQAERLLADAASVAFDVRVDQVFLPLLRELGDLWEQGSATVAQEHFASSIIRDQIVALLASLGRSGDGQRLAVCATFPGELHEMGALAMAIRLHLRGYRVTYLGANLPTEELASFCEEHRPALACVSAIVRLKRGRVLEFAREVRARASARVRIVVGGRGIDLTPPLELTGVEFVPDWHDLRT